MKGENVTAREHASILKAVQTLEKGLASPAPRRQAEWKKRIAAALAVVADEVDQHITSAEGEGGLIPQIEAELGRPSRVTAAVADHRELPDKVRALLDDLTSHGEEDGPTTTMCGRGRQNSRRNCGGTRRWKRTL